jgi:hypothetical protein
MAILDHLHVRPNLIDNAISVSSDVIAEVRNFLGLDDGPDSSITISGDTTIDDTADNFDLSTWYNMDMTTWPPTNVGRYETHSFVYAPIIMDALGHEINPGIFRSLFTFDRPTDDFDWDTIVRDVRQHFIENGGIDYWRQHVPLDGPLHPTAEFQEELFSNERLHLRGQEIAIYANHMVSLKSQEAI